MENINCIFCDTLLSLAYHTGTCSKCPEVFVKVHNWERNKYIAWRISGYFYEKKVVIHYTIDNNDIYMNIWSEGNEVVKITKIGKISITPNNYKEKLDMFWTLS